MVGADFTATHKRILKMLADGERHKRDEVFNACIEDQLARKSVLSSHISTMRKMLQPLGYDIVCELHKGINYRLVRLLSGSDE